MALKRSAIQIHLRGYIAMPKKSPDGFDWQSVGEYFIQFANWMLGETMNVSIAIPSSKIESEIAYLHC